MNFLKKNWPIIVLLLFSFFLRIYKLEDLFYFTYDESIPAFVGRRLILWNHIPLIGGATPLGFHLGPYFYWLYSLILFFGKLNPISWGLAAAAISTLTAFLTFKLARDFTNKKIAFAAAAFWAFSFLANVYDRHLWALFWGPITSLLVLYCLLKIIGGGKNYILLLAITLGLSIHADPSNFVFFILTAIVFVIYKVKPSKNVLLAIALILLSFSPLIVFDLRHDFSNTKPFFNFVKSGSNQPGFSQDKFISSSLLFPRTFSRVIYTFGDNEIAKQYSYCKQYVQEKYRAIPKISIFISILVLISFVWWSFKKNKLVIWKLISLLFLIYLFSIELYGAIFKADVFEHYIAGLFPSFILILSLIISLFPRKLFLIILAVFVFFNLYKLTQAQNSHGLKNKRDAIEYSMQQLGGEPFSLESHSTCWYYSGYRYLFAVFGREPSKSYVDPNFSYLYGDTAVNEKHPTTIVAMVIHDEKYETENFYKRYALLKSHERKSGIFGHIEVIILNNNSDWFDKIN